MHHPYEITSCVVNSLRLKILFQDVIQQITGGRRKRRDVLEEEEEVKDRVANMLLTAERNFKRLH